MTLLDILNDVCKKRKEISNGFCYWGNSDTKLDDNMKLWFDRDSTNSNFLDVRATLEQYKSLKINLNMYKNNIYINPSPNDIKNLYETMFKTGYLPSISNGSHSRDFALFQ